MSPIFIDSIHNFNEFMFDYSGNVNVIIFDGLISFINTKVDKLFDVDLLIFNNKCKQSTLFATNFFNAETIVYNCEIINLDSLTYAKSNNIVIRYSEYKKFPKETRNKIRKNFERKRNLKILSFDQFDCYCDKLLEDYC